MLEMNYEKDLADNPVIKGLEALLCTEESDFRPNNRQFNRNKDVLQNSMCMESMELSKDITSFNSSNSNVRNRSKVFNNLEFSAESRQSNLSVDPCMFSKSFVKNVSYDGCFIEGDSGIYLNQGSNTTQNQVFHEDKSILSSAVSHGGDFVLKTQQQFGMQDAYTFIKYIAHLRKTWHSLCNIMRLWNELQRTQEDSLLPSELSLPSFVLFLNTIATKLQKVLSTPKWFSIVQEIRNALDLASSIASNQFVNWKCLKHVSRIAYSLIIVLTAENSLHISRRAVLEDFFRSEKCVQVWNNLA